MPSMARIDPFASPSRNTSIQMQSLFHDSSPDFGPVKYEVNKVGYKHPQQLRSCILYQNLACAYMVLSAG